MTVDEFKSSLVNHDVEDIYNDCILGSNIWYFKEHSSGKDHYEIYDKFKKYLAKNLEIHVNNVAIVGSAKLGFSLAPKKNFRLFNSESDIDIIIVSPEIFRKSWDAYLDLSSKYFVKDYSFVSGNIFRRFVSLKTPDPRSAFFDAWSKKVEPCKKDLQVVFNISNEVNYRIYESWDAVKFYHQSGIVDLQTTIAKK